MLGTRTRSRSTHIRLSRALVLGDRPGTVVMLANVTDRLGLELMEIGWIVSWMMECYNKGLLSKKETEGLEMTRGNAEAVGVMLPKIAKQRALAIYWQRD